MDNVFSTRNSLLYASIQLTGIYQNIKPLTQSLFAKIHCCVNLWMQALRYATTALYFAFQGTVQSYTFVFNSLKGKLINAMITKRSLNSLKSRFHILLSPQKPITSSISWIWEFLFAMSQRVWVMNSFYCRLLWCSRLAENLDKVFSSAVLTSKAWIITVLDLKLNRSY